MSALELNGAQPAGLEGSSGAAKPAADGAGALAAGASSSESGCALVAKWQGSTIELPVLPRSTTIAEVKASAQQQCGERGILP